MDTIRKASTWSQFLELIRDCREELQEPETVWYRGQSRADYNLTPSLYRHPSGLEKEKSLFNEYERSASHLQAKRENDWQLLVDMQHYGIPTRLLDWTDVLGVAITFALYDGNDAEASAIYLLDPKALNKVSGVGEIRRVPNAIDQFEYKKMYWHGEPLKPQQPIAIDCQFQNARIAAQNGTFTVHGTVKEPFDGAASNYIRKIILEPTAKSEAREFLEYANLNEFSIYPDVVGMARYIVRKHLG